MRRTRRDYLRLSAAAGAVLAVPETQVMAAPAKKLRILILAGLDSPARIRSAMRSRAGTK
jgi:hypothetical protein